MTRAELIALVFSCCPDATRVTVEETGQFACFDIWITGPITFEHEDKLRKSIPFTIGVDIHRVIETEGVEIEKSGYPLLTNL